MRSLAKAVWAKCIGCGEPKEVVLGIVGEDDVQLGTCHFINWKCGCGQQNLVVDLGECSVVIQDKKLVNETIF